MGFAIMPEPPKEGVYLIPRPFHLIVVQNVCAWFDMEIFYKKGQRKPKRVSCGLINLLECEYIGEFNAGSKPLSKEDK